mgnify:CR=1 FL=1
MQRLRDIRSVQQGYITAIELREQISNNTMALQNACGKRRKELYDAYSLVLAGFNQVPIFTTPGDRDMFIESLQEFILVQEQYLRSVNRLDDLQLRGDSITAVCAKRLNDVGDAYRTLAANASFIPTFTTLAGADFFFNSLDDFEQIQQDFIRTIALRNAIALKADSITSCKGAPRELVAFYKDLQARTLLTPTFNHHDKALVYLQQLEVFINLQDHVLEGEMQAKAIEGNSMLIKSRSKNLQNIWKAYQSLLKAYEPASTVRTENDLTRYLSSQRALIDMQQVVYGIIDGPDREVVNIRLKGEKDLTMMKATMGIK